jgi:hypothetical protein
MVQIEKLAAGLVVNENFLFKIKKKKRAAELIIAKKTYFSKEKKIKQQNIAYRIFLNEERRL